MADVAAQVEASGDCPRGRARGPGSVKRRQALQRQEWDERDARAEAKVGEVLDFALAHEDALRWVDLRRWRGLRSDDGQGGPGGAGLVDLYFAPRGSARVGSDAESEHRSAARSLFEENFACLDPMAAPIAPGRWRWTKPRRVCSLEDLSDSYNRVPHPVCADTLRLRVESVLSDLGHPLFEQFEALARQVDGRLARRQMEFF